MEERLSAAANIAVRHRHLGARFSNPRSHQVSKRIFLAGASGAIGRRLAPLLVANGWLVFGSTRSKDKALGLREMGVEPVVVDVFDAPIVPGSVHVDAAARAAELAVTVGQRGIFNVAETDGSASSDLAMRTFGWNPEWRADQ